jgi:hypothetical protein
LTQALLIEAKLSYQTLSEALRSGACFLANQKVGN